MKWLFSVVPEKKPNAKVTTHDEVMWLLMLATLAAYAQITHLCGTHLWGCFIAGMCFSTQHHAHHVWVRQVKRMTCWWLRIFFACTLAWSIPVGDLFSLEAFWKGTIMGIGPCILTKVCCGPFMGSAKWVIGWAMVGRAEFAYFIAIMAKALKMMPDKLFAILIWALIYATIFAPLIFRYVLVGYMLRLEMEEAYNEKSAEEECDIPRKSLSGEIQGRNSGRLSYTLGTHLNSNVTMDSGHLPDMMEEKQQEEKRKNIEKLAMLEANEVMNQDEIRRLKDQLNQCQNDIAALSDKVQAANNEAAAAKNEAARYQGDAARAAAQVSELEKNDRQRAVEPVIRGGEENFQTAAVREPAGVPPIHQAGVIAVENDLELEVLRDDGKNQGGCGACQAAPCAAACR